MRLRRRPLLGSCLAAASLAVTRGGPLADEARFVKIGTGSVTGTYYPVGSLIAAALSSPPGARACREATDCGVPDLILVVEATKGSVANVQGIQEGRLETGFAQSDVAYAAFAGTGMFAGQPPMSELRALASLYLESVHLLVTATSGIRSVADLRGRRVSLDAEGSGTLVDARLILEAFGLSPADLQPVYVPLGRSIDMMTAGELDALFLVAGYPAGAVSELVAAIGARLVPIMGPAVGTLLQQHRFMTTSDIPSDVYTGIESGTPTVGVAALWVVAASLDETLVYQITQALWQPATLAKLAAGHPKGSEITLANALRGVAIPLHTGAARYYREHGLAE
jgi:TRAP transporter TAXI family solute receptor